MWESNKKWMMRFPITPVCLPARGNDNNKFFLLLFNKRIVEKIIIFHSYTCECSD